MPQTLLHDPVPLYRYMSTTRHPPTMYEWSRASSTTWKCNCSVGRWLSNTTWTCNRSVGGFTTIGRSLLGLSWEVGPRPCRRRCYTIPCHPIDTCQPHVNPLQCMNEHGRPALREHVTARSADSQPSWNRCWASLGRSDRDLATRSRATLSIHVNHTSTSHNVWMSTGVQHYVDM